MNETRLEYLFNRYYEKTCTTEEKGELMNMLSTHENDSAVKNLIDRLLIKASPEMELDNDTANIIIQAILKADAADQKPVLVRPVKRLFFTRVAAAAIILLLLSVGGYFYLNNKTEKQIAKTETQQEQRFKNDVKAPGTNRAM